MIAVFGATGQTGGAVVRQLVEQGVPTRALVHHPEKAQALRALGVEVVAADLNDPTALASALQGVARAYFVTSGEATRLSGSFYTAARRSGVEHLVRLSGSFMVGPESTVVFDQWHYEAEQTLERSGLAYTHLRPSYFMQNLIFQGATGQLALPFADARINLVDIRDIAAVAVAALTGSGHEGRTYAITGPEALTFTEVAARLTAATGRTFTYVPVSEAQFAQVLQQWGLSGPVAADLAREYALIGAGHPAFNLVTDTVPRLAGRPGLTVEAFARDHAQALITPPRWGGQDRATSGAGPAGR